MSWPRIPLRNLGDWYGGGTPSKANSAFWTQGTIPWLSPKDMGPEILTSTQDHITSAAVAGSAVRVVPEGSVAVVVRSGILERTIPVAVVPFETTLNQDMKALVPRDGVDPRWVAWGLRAHEQALMRETRKAGTTVASIEMPRLLAFELPVPPVEEQRRIIEILEDHLSRLDAGGRLVSAAATRVRAMRSSWTEQELRFVAGEATPLGDIVIDSKTGWDRARSFVTADGSGYRYLKMNNITTDGELDLGTVVTVSGESKVATRYRLRSGDVLFNNRNSAQLVGKTAVADDRVAGWTYNNNIVRLRLDETMVEPDFVSLVMNSHAFISSLRGHVSASTNVAALYTRDLLRQVIRVPALDAQASVVEGHRDLIGRAHRLNEAVAIARDHGTTLRRCVANAAFAGRLTDRRTDPDALEELLDA